MIFTIKGEIVKQKTEDDFVQVGWGAISKNGRIAEIIWRINKKKYAEKFIEKYDFYKLKEIYIKKEEENEWERN